MNSAAALTVLWTSRKRSGFLTWMLMQWRSWHVGWRWTDVFCITEDKNTKRESKPTWYGNKWSGASCSDSVFARLGCQSLVFSGLELSPADPRPSKFHWNKAMEYWVITEQTETLSLKPWPRFQLNPKPKKIRRWLLMWNQTPVCFMWFFYPFAFYIRETSMFLFSLTLQQRI